MSTTLRTCERGRSVHDSDWTLVDFVEWLERWANAENPDQDRRLIVAQWVMARHDDPYAGVRREPDFGNLWYGRIPGTWGADGTVMTCSYFVYEQQRRIRCNHIASLSLPA
jgi:hypothetical protein